MRLGEARIVSVGGKIPVELKNAAGFHQTDGKGDVIGWSHHPNWHAEKAGHNGSGALVVGMCLFARSGGLW